MLKVFSRKNKLTKVIFNQFMKISLPVLCQIKVRVGLYIAKLYSNGMTLLSTPQWEYYCQVSTLCLPFSEKYHETIMLLMLMEKNLCPPCGFKVLSHCKQCESFCVILCVVWCFYLLNIAQRFKFKIKILNNALAFVFWVFFFQRDRARSVLS